LTRNLSNLPSISLVMSTKSRRIHRSQLSERLKSSAKWSGCRPKLPFSGRKQKRSQDPRSRTLNMNTTSASTRTRMAKRRSSPSKRRIRCSVNSHSKAHEWSSIWTLNLCSLARRLTHCAHRWLTAQISTNELKSLWTWFSRGLARTRFTNTCFDSQWSTGQSRTTKTVI